MGPAALTELAPVDVGGREERYETDPDCGRGELALPDPVQAAGAVDDQPNGEGGRALATRLCSYNR